MNSKDFKSDIRILYNGDSVIFDKYRDEKALVFKLSKPGFDGKIVVFHFVFKYLGKLASNTNYTASEQRSAYCTKVKNTLSRLTGVPVKEISYETINLKG